MSGMVKIETLKDLILEIRSEKVLLDADVAVIYGVKTRDINKAVANNLDKFPSGYAFELSRSEKDELVENFHRFNKLKHSTVNPKAFSEKGLYMLATILRSPQATEYEILRSNITTADLNNSLRSQFATLEMGRSANQDIPQEVLKSKLKQVIL